MSGVHASDTGHFFDPAISAPPAQGATNAAGIGGDGAALPPTASRTYLEVSSAAQGYGAEGVYTNGRYRDHSGSRIGSGSRDNSAERSQGGGNTPCGIMKVSDKSASSSLSEISKVTRRKSVPKQQSKSDITVTIPRYSCLVCRRFGELV